MPKRLIYISLLILLLADLAFSFAQYYTTPLDGDMAGGIVPAESVREVLNSPLGLDAILHDKMYSNPNRFVCHWTFKTYFSTVPFWLQHFVSATDSVYLSCAIVKVLVHLALLVLLAMAVTGGKRIFRWPFLLAMLLITPLFQANGYRIYMGIIDPSVTYVFFYALPMVLLLLYFLPLLLKYYHGKSDLHPWLKLLWIPLGLAVCLSGPLNPGIVLVVSLLAGCARLKANFIQATGTFFQKFVHSLRGMPKDYWFYLLPVSIFAMYSLFLGRYNYINTLNEISTAEMYARLPSGIYYLITQKPGMAILLLIIVFNMVFIRLKFDPGTGRKIRRIFGWLGIFALIYILLLPLGGYREYRSNVLRYDTILPVTLGLMFIFAISTLFICRHMLRKQRYWYVPLIALILLIFTNADRGQFDRNACERSALGQIAASRDPIVQLNTECTVLSWGEISHAEDSRLNARLLKFWRVTGTEKLYRTGAAH